MTKTKEDMFEYNGEDYTKITFVPDLERFKMKRLEDDTVALFTKRVSRDN